MAKMSSVAYTYANALFEIAKANDDFDLWLDALAKLATAVSDQEVQCLITNPNLNVTQLLSIFLNILSNPKIEVSNFLQLLLTNDRLSLLPEIYAQFEAKVRDLRHTATAIIQSAFAMDDVQKQEFEQLLSKKFNKAVSATVEVNPLLIGGVKILIDDTVIDASVKSSLHKMATELIK